jgi:hypothetical protein
MKKLKINSLIAGALAVASTSAMATGFVTLSQTGYAVPGGTSAYTLCNTTGNFGQDDTIPPTPGANNTCAIFQNNPPLAGFSQIAGFNATRPVTFNGVVIADVNDRVWRNSARTRCIYGTRLRLRVGTSGAFEVNDVVRAGVRNRAPVSIAYFYNGIADEALFRAGLTRTSVNTPPNPARPLTSIAPISTNWVDFTTDLNANDPDETDNPDSPWFYIQSACTASAPITLQGAILIRQTGQEGQPPVTISIPGYAPAGANTNP